MSKKRSKNTTWYRSLKRDNEKLLEEVFDNRQKNNFRLSTDNVELGKGTVDAIDFRSDCSDASSFHSHEDINLLSLGEDDGVNSSNYKFDFNLNGEGTEQNDLDKLKQWAILFNINHTALEALLPILSNAAPGSFDNLPKCSRTFLRTPTTLKVKNVEPGEYYHFGIQESLQSLFQRLKLMSPTEFVKIGVNIDGLPLTKSSNSQVYPILGMLIPNQEIFMIGIYHGYEKPKDFNLFLSDFVNEASDLITNGIKICDKVYKFNIVMYLFDAVAKSSVLQIKGHSGYSSCTKCTQEGEYINDRICFPDLNFIQRSHNDFVSQADFDHHKGQTILLKVPNIDIIKDVPLDYMHLVLLGVVKKLLSGLWCSGGPPHKLSGAQIKEISQKLEQLRSYVPSEFARLPRSLYEVKRWKATEFRQFLLYTGPLVLKSVLPKKKYLNFLTLTVAITLLSNKSLCTEYADYAESLLIYFVKTVKSIYGSHILSHNFHNLLHLVNDVRKFGTLDNFSNFPCENFLQSLLKLVRKPQKPLQQIIRRYYENYNMNTNKQDQHETHSKKIIFNTFKLSADNERDNTCVLKDGTIVKIKDIIFSFEQNPVQIVGRKYKSLTSFFNLPCSSSLLKIFFVKELDQNEQHWKVVDIDYKVVCLPYENGFVVFPLIHSFNA